ncbi:MAG: DUF1329 domain-containing protein [Stenotrophobium sp.]
MYIGKLDEGYKKLLTTYSDYMMNVYPSHRIVAFPEAINKATIANLPRRGIAG